MAHGKQRQGVIDDMGGGHRPPCLSLSLTSSLTRPRPEALHRAACPLYHMGVPAPGSRMKPSVGTSGFTRAQNMTRTMLAGKIHRATVTEVNLDYEGSTMIDPSLLEASGILPYEKVQVLDITNGARVEPTPSRANVGRVKSASMARRGI